MDIRHSTHPDDAVGLDTATLRARFLVEDLFAPGEARFTLTHDDRLVLGGVVPAGVPLELPVPEELRAEAFCDRRELVVVNVGEPGTVTADGVEHTLGHHDLLYLGVGTGSVMFDGGGRFYLVSAPAGARHPAALVRAADAETLELGEESSSNRRSLRRYVHAGGVASDRLVVGITTLAPGSVWNTMPPHTHDRRTEVYLYTGLGEGRVMHLCGRPDVTRTLVVTDEQAVISPPWSIHSGVGTGAYSFVWAMAGENQAFEDMDAVDAAQLR